jgi:hypothetical protein
MWAFLLREPPVIYLDLQLAPYTQTVQRRDTQLSQCLAVVMVPTNKSSALVWRCFVSAKLLSVALPRSRGHHITNNNRLAQPASKMAQDLTLLMYSAGDWFESWPTDRLSWLRPVVFFSSCKQKPEQYLKLCHIRLLSYPLQFMTH